MEKRTIHANRRIALMGVAHTLLAGCQTAYYSTLEKFG
jgi:hypothetical protein